MLRARLLVLLCALAAAPLASADPPGGRPSNGAAAPRGARARIAFDRESHDFGPARQQQEFTTQFEIRNAGDALLRILDLETGCGCSSAIPGTREIEPGGATPLKVTFRTLSWNGPITKWVRVRSNDPDRPTAELKLSVDVSAGIVLDPPMFWFGPVLVGQSPPCSLIAKWREGTGRPFRVTGVEAPGMDMQFTVEPYEAPPWHGWKVSARFGKPPPVGRVSGTALIRTDDPEYPRISATVGAEVSGKVWLDKREIRLGLVQPAVGRTAAATARGLTADLDLGDVSVKSAKGRVAARAIRSAGNMKEWVIEVSVPPGAEAGPIEDVVEVRSSIPGEPPATIAVTGTVLPKR